MAARECQYKGCHQEAEKKVTVTVDLAEDWEDDDRSITFTVELCATHSRYPDLRDWGPGDFSLVPRP